MGITFLSAEHEVFQQGNINKVSCCRLLVINTSDQEVNITLWTPCLAYDQSSLFSNLLKGIFYQGMAAEKIELPLELLSDESNSTWHFLRYSSISALENKLFYFSTLLFLSPGGTLSTPGFSGVAANKLTQPISSTSVRTLFKHRYCKQHAKPKLQINQQVVHRHRRNLLQKLKSEKQAFCKPFDELYKPSQLLQAA